MPPKDAKIGRMNGRYLVYTENGYQPLGGIQEVTLEPAEGGTVDPSIVRVAGKATATLDISGQYEAYQELYLKPVREAWRKKTEGYIKCSAAFWAFWAYLLHGRYPKPRIAYLAGQGKTRRIRRKNIKRLLRGD